MTSSPAGGGPILAVGASFTYGDGVPDHETWPTILETVVFDYGIDQSFLRANALIRRLHPTASGTSTRFERTRTEDESRA